MCEKEWKMINKTSEEFKSEAFQKWWARHPWCAVRIDNHRPTLMHRNMLWITAVIMTGMASLWVVGLAEMSKIQQYKNQKNTLTEKQLNEKYTEKQIAKYDTYIRLLQKIK